MIKIANKDLYPHSIEKIKKQFGNLNFDLSFVDKKTMLAVGKKYYKKDTKLHNVFSFVNSEASQFPKTTSLGEIMVCYEAIGNEKDTLELIAHSVLHLQGIHHPEK